MSWCHQGRLEGNQEIGFGSLSNCFRVNFIHAKKTVIFIKKHCHNKHQRDFKWFVNNPPFYINVNMSENAQIIYLLGPEAEIHKRINVLL